MRQAGGRLKVRAILLLNLFTATVPMAAQARNLLEYAGVYRLNHHHLISIDLVTDGAGKQGLAYLDSDSCALRQLYPEASDQFIAGPVFSEQDPTKFRFEFRRGADGQVKEMQWTDIALGRTQSGTREPLKREEVEFRSGSIVLRGTLHLPSHTTSPLPLIVWIHGSSRSQRHGLFGIPQLLAYHGFAVLTYDKRGVGASEGEYLSAGFDELASDVVAALSAMRKRPDIDPARMGVMGTSQGGWLSFISARLTEDVKFIINLYGTPVEVGEQMLFDLRMDLQGSGFGSEDSAHALALQGRILSYMQGKEDWSATEQAVQLARGRPWFDHVFVSYEKTLTPGIINTGVAKMLRYEPLTDIQRFKGPVLYLLGDFDRLVDVERSTQIMADALTRGGNPDFTIVVLPKAHHGLFLGEAGGPEEGFRGMDASKRLSFLAPGYIDILLRWLYTRVGGVQTGSQELDPV